MSSNMEKLGDFIADQWKPRSLYAQFDNAYNTFIENSNEENFNKVGEAYDSIPEYSITDNMSRKMLRSIERFLHENYNRPFYMAHTEFMENPNDATYEKLNNVYKAIPHKYLGTEIKNIMSKAAEKLTPTSTSGGSRRRRNTTSRSKKSRKSTRKSSRRHNKKSNRRYRKYRR